MGKSNEITGSILYGLLFAAIIPLILILWAKFTRNTVTIPLPVTLLPGYILLFTGAIFVCIGMWNIWRLGNGLPMSAFPPEKYVRNGIYAFIKHPIYFGAALVSFGLSAITRSASGFWLVSPVFTLLMVAYTTGYENERTQSVFGTQDHKPFLSLPPDSNQEFLCTRHSSIQSVPILLQAWY